MKVASFLFYNREGGIKVFLQNNTGMLSFSNISKMPDFDVLTLSDSRKRKSRSHGIRKRGNDRRKRCAALKLKFSLMI